MKIDYISRVEMMCKQQFPSIVQGYLDDGWTKPETIVKLGEYSETGHILATLITDPILRFVLEENLDACYDKSIKKIDDV